MFEKSKLLESRTVVLNSISKVKTKVLEDRLKFVIDENSTVVDQLTKCEKANKILTDH